MHSSMTSSRRYGRNARTVNASDDASPTELAACGAGLEFIDGPEVQIARDEHLYSVALMFHDGGRDVDRAFQYIGHDILGREGLTMTVPLLPPLDWTAARTAPSITDTNIAAPKRSQK